MDISKVLVCNNLRHSPCCIHNIAQLNIICNTNLNKTKVTLSAQYKENKRRYIMENNTNNLNENQNVNNV